MKQKFSPKPGQTDYTHIRYAPVINCVVRFGKKILLIRRSDTLHFYPGVWNGVSGFLDDDKSVEEKVLEELREELGMEKEHVKSIVLGILFHQEAPDIGKTWIVHPVLVEVNTDAIRLDWEGAECRWILPEEVRNFDLMPGFEKVLQCVAAFSKEK